MDTTPLYVVIISVAAGAIQAVAVVWALVYNARQTKHLGTQIKFNTIVSTSLHLKGVNELLVQDEKLARLLRGSRKGALGSILLGTFELWFLLHEEHFTDDEWWKADDITITETMQLPFMQQAWKKDGHQYHKAFRTYIDAKIPKSQSFSLWQLILKLLKRNSKNSEKSTPPALPNQTSTRSSQGGRIILNKVGEYPHYPHYNVRTAAQSYSNIAAVLAGFAFAAIILVIQNTQSPQNIPDAAFLRDWATISFVVAFFGCILSAFAFSVVSGEEILAPRTNMMAFFGGIGFSISASLIFWSLVTLAKIYLDANIVVLARLLYPVFALIHPAYFAFTAMDNVFLFKDERPEKHEWVRIFLIGYAPLIVTVPLAIVLQLLGRSLTLITPLLWCSVILSVVAIMASSVVALVISDKSHEFEFSSLACSFAILAHSVVMGLLILTV